jgi:hypothetical protein
VIIGVLERRINHVWVSEQRVNEKGDAVEIAEMLPLAPSSTPHLNGSERNNTFGG